MAVYFTDYYIYNNLAIYRRRCITFATSFKSFQFTFICWDSAVGIATGYGLDDRGVGIRVPVVLRIFTSPSRPDRVWGSTQPPI
jgi:hypothetical protein